MDVDEEAVGLLVLLVVVVVVVVLLLELPLAFVVIPRAVLEEEDEFRLDDNVDGLDGVPEEDGLNPVAEPARNAAKKFARKVGRLEGIGGSISPKLASLQLSLQS